jgi:hypothetical protein
VTAFFGQCNYSDTIVFNGNLGHIEFVYAAMEGFHCSLEFYQYVLAKIQTYLLTVDPCASLKASEVPVMFAGVCVEYDIDSEHDARFPLPIPMEIDALLNFPLPKMAIQQGKEDHGLFAFLHMVYDLNIGCQYGYQAEHEETLALELAVGADLAPLFGIRTGNGTATVCAGTPTSTH